MRNEVVMAQGLKPRKRPKRYELGGGGISLCPFYFLSFLFLFIYFLFNLFYSKFLIDPWLKGGVLLGIFRKKKKKTKRKSSKGIPY